MHATTTTTTTTTGTHKTEVMRTTGTTDIHTTGVTIDNSHFIPDMNKDPTQKMNTTNPHAIVNPQHTETNKGSQNGRSSHATPIRDENRITEDGPNHGTRTMPSKTKDLKLNIAAETLNCHGFAQSSEYVISRLQYCNILCLSETWIWPHEVNLIADTISKHPSTRNSCQEYTVISNVACKTRSQTTQGLAMVVSR